jgi:hypothetical protein
MTFFKNVLLSISNTKNQKVNFRQIVEVRRMKMERMGLDTDYIDWVHYAKVLEEKHRRIKTN